MNAGKVTFVSQFDASQKRSFPELSSEIVREEIPIVLEGLEPTSYVGIHLSFILTVNRFMVGKK